MGARAPLLTLRKWFQSELHNETFFLLLISWIVLLSWRHRKWWNSNTRSNDLVAEVAQAFFEQCSEQLYQPTVSLKRFADNRMKLTKDFTRFCFKQAPCVTVFCAKRPILIVCKKLRLQKYLLVFWNTVYQRNTVLVFLFLGKIKKFFSHIQSPKDDLINETKTRNSCFKIFKSFVAWWL